MRTFQELHKLEAQLDYHETQIKVMTEQWKKITDKHKRRREVLLKKIKEIKKKHGLRN